MAEHTPGPLFVAEQQINILSPGPKFGILDSGGVLIGEAFRVVGDGAIRPAQANARLWAASPLLLAACKAWRAGADHRAACKTCTPESYCKTALALMQRAWQMTQPALAAAKGEK